SGYVAKHGYTVENGWFTGVCSGHLHAPLQRDRSVTDATIEHFRIRVPQLLAQARAYESGERTPRTLRRHVTRPGEPTTIEWEAASDIQRKRGLIEEIARLRQLARTGEALASQLGRLANDVHGKPLRETQIPAPAARILPGEQRISATGRVLTCTYLRGARVCWADERGTNSWTGSAAWRGLPPVPAPSLDDD